MDYKKIGKFIVTEREKIEYTQEELATKLYVTRQAVSKWERGLALPDVSIMLDLCKVFNITANELLAGKRIDKNNKQEINNISIDVLKYGKEKRKKMIICFTTIIVFIILLFFVYYFLSTYNKLKVFKISGNNNKFQIVDTIGVFSNETAYLKFSEVYSENLTPKYVEYYYVKSDQRRIILSSDKGDALIIQNKGYAEYFDFNDIELIFNNLYVDIYYEEDNIGKIETIKLKTERQYSNNNLFFKDSSKVTNEIFLYPNKKENTKLNSIFKKNEKGEFSYSYIENDMKITINYNQENEVIFITRKNKDYTEEILYLGKERNEVNYSKYDSKNKIISESSLINNNFQCLKGKCDDDRNIYNEIENQILEKYFKS